MKKGLCLFAVLVILVGNTTTVLAGSHHSRSRGTTVKYSVCTLEDCTRTVAHKHQRKTYAAHYYGDGHSYHEYCNERGCDLNGYHEHGGVYCFQNTSTNTRYNRGACCR